MRLKQWLLTGTSLTLMTLAPIGAAYAQDATDPALVSAYTAFQADPSDANRDALKEACIAAGFKSLDDCIAAITGQAPVENASSDVSSAQPETASSAEETVSSSEAAPVESSSVESPSSSSEAPVSTEAPSSSAEAAPVSSSEAAPVSSSAEEVTSSSTDQTMSSAPASDQNDVLAQLTAAVDAFNLAVSQNDTAGADAAMAQINAICTSAGFADVTACLAQFSLTLNVPASDMSSASDMTSVSASASAAMSEQPQASEMVDPNAVEVLPSDVASEAAPVLDSAKDQQNASSAPSSAAPTDTSSSAPASDVSSSSAEQQPTQPVTPPQTDADAQASIQPPPDQQAVLTEQGEKKGADFVFVQPPPPENVQVIETPRQDQGSFVFKIGVNIYINNTVQTRERLYDRQRGDQIYYEDLSRGRTRETIERRDGTKIITIYDRYGDVLQRSKVLGDGRTIILASYDPRYEDDLTNWRDPGDDLPPLVLNIPVNQYILDADEADESQVELFLSQPPVEHVQRLYSIDEVKRSARLRDSVRRLEIGDLTFATGQATISKDQVGSLAKVAKAMLKLLAQSPGEVFLIEGHTDAVGSDVSNLVLSDERAATVARILTDFYDIPAENLVTQGYGERYLKVKTEGPERLNRRVTIKRITPLVAYEENK